MRVILFFIDGIGIGKNNINYNPCCFSATGIFNSNSNNIPLKGKLIPLDACLDIPGIPQSATGQTSIYTGMNAAAEIGKHLDGFPNNRLCSLLYKHSIFVDLTSKGYRCKFINAFRPIFFTTPELFKNIKMSATTEMNKAAGLPFSSLNGIKNGTAIYHDFTNGVLIKYGFDIPAYSPDTAAEILVNESRHNDLILYEYFLTDFAGHSQNMKNAVDEITKVENFIFAILKKVDIETTTFIVASDHGNIEDIRIKSHTLNPAYMAIWGKNSNGNNFNIKSLIDIKPLIVNLISGMN